ncbi:indole-3-glycerol phosphate synthase TrpC [Sporolactobacillus nakayamae]|uniref:Indole-3-glycerol phosphate synthase n=1 Tax=Sporolactobacillus nakayamae TaxID=269670 RepID=A0A1I2MVJ5_9BACL|nr:indole-3-glycerol phosphate synthase TrpC [Sporolactobacillus nakayamae]SFF95595.1 indole-3-glycerol phosphate synthase [Sporolactobacillus nakayamae]
MPKSFLDRILQTKLEELAVFTMPDRVCEQQEHYSLKKALRNANHELGLIAEVKQASPSKGIFAPRIIPARVAKAYARAGADAISVLTDRTYFHGSTEHLREVRGSVQLPILRKDFIIDERQIEEADRCGADAILLIAAALDPLKLHEFYLAAQDRGLESLVEVHCVEELERILRMFTPEIIGINNRNLKTFETSLSVTETVAKVVPNEVVLVSESGVHKAQDVCFLRDQGATAALVGEALICSGSPEQKICDLFGEVVKSNASFT